MALEHDSLLTRTIAEHFASARIAGDEIELGFGGVVMKCRVAAVGRVGGYQAASLSFELRGGVAGELSVNGYGESAERAIAGGACDWACAFGPVLRAGLGGEAVADAPAHEVMVDGRRFRLFVRALDRLMVFPGGDGARRTEAARERLGAAPWLTSRVLAAGGLPIPAERPAILSVHVCDAADVRTVEVEVNGVAVMSRAFEDAPPEPPGAMTLLRELAVLVPA